LAGLDRPTSGRVHLGEKEISGLREDELSALRRRRIGFVFQAFNLVPTLTVKDNIRLPFELDDRRPNADERVWISTVVSRLGLESRLKHRPGELSGGQQQRTAIARALATRPDILFADEPTGNLDARSGREVMAIMSEAVRDLGQSIVLVTHDPLVAAHADRVVFLADGTPVTELAEAISAEAIAQTMLGLGERAEAAGSRRSARCARSWPIRDSSSPASSSSSSLPSSAPPSCRASRFSPHGCPRPRSSRSRTTHRICSPWSDSSSSSS